MVGGERTTCASTASSLNLRRANARRPLTHSLNASYTADGQQSLSLHTIILAKTYSVYNTSYSNWIRTQLVVLHYGDPQRHHPPSIQASLSVQLLNPTFSLLATVADDTIQCILTVRGPCIKIHNMPQRTECQRPRRTSTKTGSSRRGGVGRQHTDRMHIISLQLLCPPCLICDISHAHLHVYSLTQPHRTIAAAHVRPAPKPAMATTSPSFTFPARTASSNARGMLAALVLPYSARLLICRHTSPHTTSDYYTS
jgi:hypothetical protein